MVYAEYNPRFSLDLDLTMKIIKKVFELKLINMSFYEIIQNVFLGTSKIGTDCLDWQANSNSYNGSRTRE